MCGMAVPRSMAVPAMFTGGMPVPLSHGRDARATSHLSHMSHMSHKNMRSFDLNLSVDTGSTRRAFLFAAVLLFFFVSGACGLMYQVVWTRQLVLLVGTRAHAVSMVLGIFFLGLGLGSYWGGRVADRTARPLAWYAGIEAVIGVWALLAALLMHPAESAAVALLRAAGGAPLAGTLARGLMAMLLLLAPVTLMGATLPLLARFTTADPALGGRRVGLLYAFNTFGAMAGCFVTGFFLIARFGYLRTVLIAAALNLFVGASAWALSRMRGGTDGHGQARTPELGDGTGVDMAGGGTVGHGQARTPAPEAAPGGVVLLSPGGAPWLAVVLVAAFAVTGFSALALEVVWTRLLAMVFLGTTHAFTAMLTTLLCGIALGGMAGAALLSPRMRVSPSTLAGVLLLLLGLVYLWMVHAFDTLPARALEMRRSSGNQWDAAVRAMFIQSFLTLFPGTFISGMLFPVLVRAVARNAGRIGRDVGGLYAANTLGGVLGAAAGGFLLLPWLGAQGAMALLALLPLPFGAAVLCRGGGKALRAAAAAVLLGCAAWLWATLPEDINRSLSASYMPEDHEVIFYREGVEGTVAVSQPKGVADGADRVLWINRVQATTSIERGVKMNRLQGALPLLFAHAPKEVLFMCFGSGITCGTLALSDFDRIDAVEISPEVLEAAPLFARDNLGVLDRPNIHFIVDDARNFLLTTERRYDLITFEPMPLALAGVSNFYTEDYYRLCLARLRPGGLVSQWVPLHSLSPEVVASLVFTFTRVFPEYAAFFVNADLFLIGSDRPLRLDLEAARARLARPELAEALTLADLGDPIEVMGAFLLDKAAVDAFARGGRVMRDDLPWAEFEAPKLVYERKVPESLDRLRPLAVPPTALMDPERLAPEDRERLERRHRARVLDLAALREYYGGFVLGDGALDGFIASLREDPENPTAKYYLRQIVHAQGETFLRWDQPENVRGLLDKVRPWLPGDPVVEALAERIE